VNLLGGTLSSGTLTLNPLGTVTTANQRYLFTGGYTVNAGATLTFGANANVVINQGQTIQNNGTLAVQSGVTVVAAETYYPTFGIVDNGSMTTASTAIFSHTN